MKIVSRENLLNTLFCVYCDSLIKNRWILSEVLNQ